MAQTSANYSGTTAPYIQLSVPITVNGGGQSTLPTIKVTLQATGAPGTVSKTSLTEFSVSTSTSLAAVNFHGYPSDPTEPDVKPVVFPPVPLATTNITN